MHFGKQTIQYNRVHVDQSVPFPPTHTAILLVVSWGGGRGRSSWGGVVRGGGVPYLCIR